MNNLWKIALILFIILALVMAMYTGVPTWIFSRDIGSRLYGGGARDKVKNLRTNPRSKSEAAAIKILETLVGAKFPTMYPDWLKSDRGNPMELDGYNAKLKLAIEFSGPLHTKWFPSTESYESYFLRLQNDALKRKLCAEHDVCLIVLDISLPRHHWRNYLASRLHDCGFSVKPALYIEEQTAVAYRNPQLEETLGLEMDVPRR